MILFGLLFVILMIVIGVFYFLQSRPVEIDISYKGPPLSKVNLINESEASKIRHKNQYVPSSMLYMYKTDNMQPIDPFGSIFDLDSEPVDNWETNVKDIKNNKDRQFIEQVYLEDKA